MVSVDFQPDQRAQAASHHRAVSSGPVSLVESSTGSGSSAATTAAAAATGSGSGSRAAAANGSESSSDGISIVGVASKTGPSLASDPEGATSNDSARGADGVNCTPDSSSSRGNRTPESSASAWA